MASRYPTPRVRQPADNQKNEKVETERPQVLEKFGLVEDDIEGSRLRSFRKDLRLAIKMCLYFA